MGAWSYGKQEKGNLSVKWPVCVLTGSSVSYINTNHTANLKQNKTTKKTHKTNTQKFPYYKIFNTSQWYNYRLVFPWWDWIECCPEYKGLHKIMKQMKHLLFLTKRSFILPLAQSFILQLSILAISERLYFHVLVLGGLLVFLQLTRALTTHRDTTLPIPAFLCQRIFLCCKSLQNLVNLNKYRNVSQHT